MPFNIPLAESVALGELAVSTTSFVGREVAEPAVVVMDSSSARRSFKDDGGAGRVAVKKPEKEMVGAAEEEVREEAVRIEGTTEKVGEIGTAAGVDDLRGYRGGELVVLGDSAVLDIGGISSFTLTCSESSDTQAVLGQKKSRSSPDWS